MGLSEKEIKQIGIAGLLHDIGKIAIPNRLLMKKGKLDDDEFALMKQHPVYGSQLLNHIPELNECLPLILYHHEWFNGKGYPHGLKASQIPLGARILAISDTFDAITSDRAYRLKREPTIAYKELIKFSGTQFDSDIVDTFMEWVQVSDPLTLLYPQADQQ